MTRIREEEDQYLCISWRSNSFISNLAIQQAN